MTKLALKTADIVAHQKIGREAEGIALSPDEREIYVTNRVDHTLTFLDTNDLEVTRVLDTDRGPIRVALFASGAHAVVTNTLQGTAQTIDRALGETDGRFATTHTYSGATGKFLQSIFGLLKVPITIVVREDQRTADVANSSAGNISLVDLQGRAVLHTFVAGKEPDGMALSPLAVERMTPSAQNGFNGEAAAYLQAQENALCTARDATGHCMDANGFARDGVETVYVQRRQDPTEFRWGSSQ